MEIVKLKMKAVEIVQKCDSCYGKNAQWTKDGHSYYVRLLSPLVFVVLINKSVIMAITICSSNIGQMEDVGKL